MSERQDDATLEHDWREADEAYNAEVERDYAMWLNSLTGEERRRHWNSVDYWTGYWPREARCGVCGSPAWELKDNQRRITRFVCTEATCMHQREWRGMK